MSVKNEQYKRLFRFAGMIWIILLMGAAFWIIWMRRYNLVIDQAFAMRGNWLILGLYLLILILFTNVYGGFKIGYQKPGSLTLSQSIAVIGTNFIEYIVIVLLSSSVYLNTGRLVSPLWLILMTVGQIICIAASAWGLTAIYNHIFPPRELLMIYGNYEESAQTLAEKMNSMKEKYHIGEMIHESAGPEVLQEKILQSQGVVLIDVEEELRNSLVKFCYGESIRVYIAPNIPDIILTGAEELHFFDTPLLLSRNSGLSIEQKLAKRLMDLLISGIGIVITSPFMLIIAAAVKLYDGGPVLFRQARVTEGGRVFMICKFRSMIVDAEKEGHSIPATDNDPRITPVGRVIRATRLDELPQLFNIFRGDMSIVGPRPERVEHVEQYTKEIPEFSYRLKVKGGLTGFAQIYGKYNTSAYDKLKLDLMYIENYSVALDLKLILMTVKIMFTKESTEGFTEEESRRMEAADDGGRE